MRGDIQCLRGIAIILVILFHLWPSLFVNGFLGVDIFFVISGFLMAKTLTQSELTTPGDFLAFYYRRFRRILPLYLLIVLFTVIMVHLYLAEFLWNNNNRYSLASLCLVTNQLVIADESDYFKEFLAASSSINAFLHLWSLSVEMQFYLFVPFVFYGLQFLKQDLWKMIAVLITSTLGFIAFSVALERFAFNFMFLRLWQFSAGFVSLYWIKLSEQDFPKKEKNPNFLRIFKSPVTNDEAAIISISIITLCLIPNEINVKVLRLLVTAATAFILASEPHDSTLFKSRTLVYIGDISYVMYLVHWPIITIFLSSTLHSYIFCILTIAISSVLLHHLFEKNYLKLDQKAVISLVLLLFSCNALLQYNIRHANFFKNNLPEETKEIIKNNMISAEFQKENAPKNCDENDLQIPFLEQKEALLNCRYPRGNGTESIMILGNSYAQHLGENLRTHFQGNYSDFRTISIIENFAIYAGKTAQALNALDVSMKQVELHKPDVLIVMVRFMQNMKDPIKENDELVQVINRNIAFYEKFVKKVYIMGSHPLYPGNFLTTFLHYLITKPDDIESLHMNKVKADHEMRFVKKRLQLIKCQKCHVFDLSHVFVENGKYLMFDRDSLMSYVDGDIHITAEGMKLCEPVLEKVAREIMERV